MEMRLVVAERDWFGRSVDVNAGMVQFDGDQAGGGEAGP